MDNDHGFIAYLHELLDPLGRIATRKMFGGHGVYCDGLFFALVIDNRLYLKVDDETRAQFQAAGSTAFVYQSKAKQVIMSYWNAPEQALDSAEQMQPWAKLAIAAAKRKPAVQAAKKLSSRKTPVTKRNVQRRTGEQQ